MEGASFIHKGESRKLWMDMIVLRVGMPSF
jgi:hypothetical protein